ncbi:hypothetical protein K525DRAFT_363196 [Schizophyllum commune Loenen D]|nr:hypothetical protein K525DRAFT_363196 [Schizophyllum commune Loenen D]
MTDMTPQYRSATFGANPSHFMGGMRGLPQEPGKGWMMFGIGAFMGITALSYWWGYNDIDRRHRGRELWLNKQAESDQIEAAQAL